MWIRIIVVVVVVVVVVVILSKLHTQCGAWTQNPEVKSHVFHQASQDALNQNKFFAYIDTSTHTHTHTHTLLVPSAFLHRIVFVFLLKTSCPVICGSIPVLCCVPSVCFSVFMPVQDYSYCKAVWKAEALGPLVIPLLTCFPVIACWFVSCTPTKQPKFRDPFLCISNGWQSVWYRVGFFCFN